jgi:hypothetical protein
MSLVGHVTCGRGEVCTGFWWGILKERDHLEYPGIDGRTILRWSFQEVGWGDMDWIDLAQEWDRWQELLNAGNILTS